jgi:hypothetical protein
MDGPDNTAPGETLEDRPLIDRLSEVVLPEEAVAEGEFHDRAVNALQQVGLDEIDDVDRLEVFETVMFSLDGRHYTLDLSGDKAAELRDKLAPFVAVARVSRGGGTGRRASSAGGPRRRRSSGDQKKNAAIRE